MTNMVMYIGVLDTIWVLLSLGDILKWLLYSPTSIYTSIKRGACRVDIPQCLRD